MIVVSLKHFHIEIILLCTTLSFVLFFCSLNGCSGGQLLMPHVRTSLQINFQARVSLLAANGVFDKVKHEL